YERLAEEILRRARHPDGSEPTSADLLEIISRMLHEDSSWSEMLRKLVEPPAAGTPSERRAIEEEFLEKPGMRERTQPENFREGNEAHRDAPTRDGESKEYELPSGGRMDRYDPLQHHIREIKPNSAPAILAGLIQLERYRRELERLTRIPHTIELTTYEP